MQHFLLYIEVLSIEALEHAFREQSPPAFTDHLVQLVQLLLLEEYDLKPVKTWFSFSEASVGVV